MKNRLMKGSLAALVSLLATNAMAAQEVTVYTAFETDILARISENDSAGGVHVTVRYLPADGVTSDGAEAVYGLSNARVNS